MKTKYQIHNEVRDKHYGCTKEQADGEQWKQKHIDNNTFGKPEREIHYKTELIDGESITVTEDSFDDDLLDRILSERDDTTDMIGELVDETYEGTKYKRYYRTVKADYVITETDVTVELAEKEQKEIDKQTKKDAAVVTLAGIAALDLTKKADLDIAIRSIVEYLEIEIAE